MTTTAMAYPLLRSALCLAMLAVCFAALQCIAESSVRNTNGNSVVSKVAGSPAGSLPSGNSVKSNLIGAAIFNYCKKNGNCTITVRPPAVKSSPVGNSLPAVVKQTPDEGHEQPDPKVTETTTNTENKALGTDSLGSGSSSSSSSSSSSTPDVIRGSQSGLPSDGSSLSGKETLAGSEVTPATTTKTTTANSGTPAGQREALTRNASGQTSVTKGDAPDMTQTSTEENSDATTTSSQTTATATSVQTLMTTTSTAAPKDIPQTSLTYTTESAKGEFTETENLLPKLSKAVQSADNKDGNVGHSSVFALSALVTVVVIAVAASF